jgi:toxin ParE1/3/4
MGRFILLPSAQADLQRLVAAIGDPKSSAPAARALSRLISAFETLATFPFAGVAIQPPYRQHTVRFGKFGFVIRYRVTPDLIVITRIWHGREERPR